VQTDLLKTIYYKKNTQLKENKVQAMDVLLLSSWSLFYSKVFHCSCCFVRKM